MSRPSKAKVRPVDRLPDPAHPDRACQGQVDRTHNSAGGRSENSRPTQKGETMKSTRSFKAGLAHAMWLLVIVGFAATSSVVVAPPPVEKVTICHCPPGNPDNCNTLTVGAPAVDAHLAHGDTLGSCDGFCVPGPPADEGFKEKQDPQTKVAKLLQSTEFPSALAGAFFRLAKAFESGRPPANDLEEQAFAVLADLPTQAALQCSLSQVAALSPDERMTLFGPILAGATDEPLTVLSLSTAVAQEFLGRLGRLTFDQPGGVCLDGERPGLPRVSQFCEDVDGPSDGFCPRICRIRTSSLVRAIRTVGFLPRLTPGELDLDEIEQTCVLDPSGLPNCQTVLPPLCTGNGVSGACLTVPHVQRNDTVILEGFNFFDVDAKVLLIGPVVREVEAHVCGDVDTPVTEPVDCRIRDILTFIIPDDLPEGLYSIAIKVPNNTGDPVFDKPFYQSAASSDPYIRVIPPVTTQFQLASEELFCIDETGRFDFTGSDEVGIRILTVPIASDGSLGALNSVSFEFCNVDSGNRRRMDRVHFSGVVGAGLSLAIVGFEIDNRDAFEQQVRTFEEAWALILESNWNEIAETLGGLLEAGLTIAGYGEYSEIAGELLEKSFIFFVALWAPADLIIEDSAGIPFVRLAELTSINFPNPPTIERTTAGDIDVKVEPCGDTPDEDFPECPATAKAPFQYTERRQYDSGGERSEYQITLRYNRISPLGVTPPPCPRDVNGDGSVNVPDLLALLAVWGTNPGGPPDFDGDGVVAVPDLLTLLAAWGPCQ